MTLQSKGANRRSSCWLEATLAAEVRKTMISDEIADDDK